ncbi:MAG: CPBP family intramembrane glutamic endopeptidase [Actinomycetota bacterium]
MSAALLAAVLVAYNNLINLWPPFQRLYVWINACAAAAVAGLALGPLNLEPITVGLTGNTLSEAGAGAAAGVILTCPLYLALASPRSTKLIADRRLDDVDVRELLQRVFYRVPLGTALLEEVAFRGVLFGLLLENGVAEAAVISSAAFGLWHIVPTFETARVNRALSGSIRFWAIAAGAVAAFGAGLVFVWLRVLTGGLAAPFAMHAAVNSSATLAGFLALRAASAASEN